MAEDTQSSPYFRVRSDLNSDVQHLGVRGGNISKRHLSQSWHGPCSLEVAANETGVSTLQIVVHLHTGSFWQPGEMIAS